MKTFAEQLPEIAGGALNEELTDALSDIFEFINSRQGSPELTLKMKFTSQMSKTGPMVKIAYHVSVKTPKEKPVDFSMFITPEGNLILENPNQGSLNFKEVKIDRPQPEVVQTFSRKKLTKINQETGEILND